MQMMQTLLDTAGISLLTRKNKGEPGSEPSEVVLPITFKMHQHSISWTQHWFGSWESTEISYGKEQACIILRFLNVIPQALVALANLGF